VFLSCSDVTAKYLSASVPAVEIAWLRYSVFLLIMLPAIFHSGPRRVLRSRKPGLQVFRAIALVTSSILFISSLRFLPIAEATATSFAAPIFITALSVLLLGEKVGLRRWSATSVGLLGVLVVVRPGTSGFQPAFILPLLAALGWASAVVVTRRTSAADDALTTLSYSAVIGVLVLTILIPFVWMPLDWRAVAFGVLIGCAATTGHWLIVIAFRYADASVLAPFTYMQLVWSTCLGVFLFGAIPDLWTITGASVIMVSGLYTAHREPSEAVKERSLARAWQSEAPHQSPAFLACRTPNWRGSMSRRTPASPSLWCGQQSRAVPVCQKGYARSRSPRHLGIRQRDSACGAFR
jgi:drug/metabolite transporter (DMT)-like permease